MVYHRTGAKWILAVHKTLRRCFGLVGPQCLEVLWNRVWFGLGGGGILHESCFIPGKKKNKDTFAMEVRWPANTKVVRACLIGQLRRCFSGASGCDLRNPANETQIALSTVG